MRAALLVEYDSPLEVTSVADPETTPTGKVAKMAADAKDAKTQATAGEAGRNGLSSDKLPPEFVGRHFRSCRLCAHKVPER